MSWTPKQDALAEKVQDVVLEALVNADVEIIDISHEEWSAIVVGLARIQVGATLACGQFSTPNRQEQAADAVRLAFLEQLKHAQADFDASGGGTLN